MIITALSCAWIMGIFLGSLFNIPLLLLVTGLLPVPLIFIFKNHRKLLIILGLCLIVLFGAAVYYPSRAITASPLSSWNNQGVVEIQGVIDSSPEVHDSLTHIDLTAQSIKIADKWMPTEGRVLLYVPRYPVYQYGDVLWIKGQLASPLQFSDFDYQSYLSRQNIFTTMLNPQIKVVQKDAGSQLLKWIYNFREHLSQNLAAALPEPQAALCQGIVLGLRGNMPDTLKNDFAVTGTAQILAISGINLTIIAGILVSLGLWLFGRRYYIYVWLSLLIVWFYSFLVGMQPPVIRSAIMASIFLIAEILGRQKNAFPALALSAAVMVGISPQVLRDISFQLSFLAMAGLLLIAPPLQSLGKRLVDRIFPEEGLAAHTGVMVTNSFSVTLGTLIVVWPVIAFNFGIFSIMSPVSNFLLSPDLSPIIVLGAISGLLGFISLPLAQVIGWFTWLFLSYMIWLVKVFAGFPPLAISNGIINTNLGWIYYSLLTLVILVKAHYQKALILAGRLFELFKNALFVSLKNWSRIPRKLILIPLLAVACLSSYSAVTLPDNDLHVSVLDVGEGDSILIQTGYQNILIDGGPSPQSVTQALGRKMPFWQRKLDLVVLTHPHLDHLGGLIEVLQRYQVSQVLDPNLRSDSPFYRQWQDIIRSKNIHYTLACAGQQIQLHNQASLAVLNPPDTAPGKTESDLENNGIVSRLKRDQISFLFTADIGQEAENRLLSQRAEIVSTVLKVAHHGSESSTTANFLAVAHPQIAVISVGSDNTFGHPSDQAIGRLKNAGILPSNVYRTDKSGTIEFTTDGQRLWVKTEK